MLSLQDDEVFDLNTLHDTALADDEYRMNINGNDIKYEIPEHEVMLLLILFIEGRR